MPKPPKHSSLEPLISIARRGLPFTSPDGQAFVRLDSACSDGSYILPVRSPEYRNWFFAQFFAEYETIPSSYAFRAILQHLEAQADADPANRCCNVFRRVGARGSGYFPNQILLDLADPECQFVEISPTGWRTTTARNVNFQTSRSTAPSCIAPERNIARNSFRTCRSMIRSSIADINPSCGIAPKQSETSDSATHRLPSHASSMRTWSASC